MLPAVSLGYSCVLATALFSVVIGWFGGGVCGQGSLELLLAWNPECSHGGLDCADSLQPLASGDYRRAPPGPDFLATLILLFFPLVSACLLVRLSVCLFAYITFLAWISLCSPGLEPLLCIPRARTVGVRHHA